jgi:hypothetical protein
MPQFRRRGLQHARAGDDDEVKAARTGRILAERLSNRAFDTAAIDGSYGHSSRNGYSEPAVRQSIGASKYREQSVLALAAGAHQVPKLAAFSDAVSPGEKKTGRCRIQALRRARPFARRALRTLRPPFVAILARNPWTRLRFSSLG